MTEDRKQKLVTQLQLAIHRKERQLKELDKTNQEIENIEFSLRLLNNG